MVGRRTIVVSLGVLVTAAGVATVTGRSQATPTLAPTSTGIGGCGYERWPVKTLAVSGASALHLGSPQSRTVGYLVHRPIAQGGQTTRLAGPETTSYRVHAKLLAAKVESDSDIHLEIADPASGETMIAEIPALACTRGASAANRKLMEKARVAFLTGCGDPGASTFTVYPAAAAATIRGVGFFDFNHHQRGVALNAIELHPVTAITVTGCR